MSNKRLRVIYLDDEKDLLENFADTFSDERIEILTFTKADQALKEIKAQAPDLLILDYRLEGITGDQVAAQVDPKIPKILISGDPEITVKSQFLKVFGKPISIDEFSDFFKKWPL